MIALLLTLALRSDAGPVRPLLPQDPTMHASRALLVAPVARDLAAEFPDQDVVPIPGATNGVLRGWDCLDEHYFTTLADSEITVYPTLLAIPNAMKRYLVQFLTAPDAQLSEPYTWVRWLDCTADHWIRVRNNGGPITVKRATNLIAGDRPQDARPMHHWQGNVEETLGDA